MKIKVFGKEIEIDENNQGIKYYIDNIGPTIDETMTLYWYKVRKQILSDEEGAADLRKMSKNEMQECVLQNIKEELLAYDFSKEYAKYV